MRYALIGLAVLLLALGAAFGTIVNPRAIYAFKAGDYGGALAAGTMRFIPFALAARWAWNKAMGRKTRTALIVILTLWVVIGLFTMGQGRP